MGQRIDHRLLRDMLGPGVLVAGGDVLLVLAQRGLHPQQLGADRDCRALHEAILRVELHDDVDVAGMAAAQPHNGFGLRSGGGAAGGDVSLRLAMAAWSWASTASGISAGGGGGRERRV